LQRGASEAQRGSSVTAPMYNEAQRVSSVAAAGLQRGDSVAGTLHNVASGRNWQKIVHNVWVNVAVERGGHNVTV
jgi:hypothetical protein